MTLNVDKRPRYGLQIGLALAVARAIDLVAQRVIAQPKTLEGKNDLLVTGAVQRLTESPRLLGKRSGSRKISIRRASGVRLVAGTNNERRSATLESFCRFCRPGTRRRTASEQNNCQPQHGKYDTSHDDHLADFNRNSR